MHVLLVLTPLLLAAFSTERQDRLAPTTGKGPSTGLVCFKTGEQISGMNKICYYDCLGSAYAITIKSTELCPLSIKR